MKTIVVHNIKGKAAKKVSLDQDYFDGKINTSLLHQASSAYLSNNRRGCAATKTRCQVSGGGRKPWRQKGTGRARVGSIRSPLWRGGGVIFGPHPRQYGYGLPKKIKILALQMSLNGKARDNELLLVEDIPQGQGRTKELASFLAALKAEEKSLIVLDKHNPDILRAAGNIPGVKVKVFSDISVLDILKHKKVIFSLPALENLIKLRKRRK